MLTGEKGGEFFHRSPPSRIAKVSSTEGGMRVAQLSVLQDNMSENGVSIHKKEGERFTENIRQDLLNPEARGKKENIPN